MIIAVSLQLHGRDGLTSATGPPERRPVDGFEFLDIVRVLFREPQTIAPCVLGSVH